MASKVSYKASVERDLKHLDRPTAARLLAQLERDLRADPHRGLPLTGEFHGLFKYRIGDCRIIYTKAVDGVLVLRIRHRKDVHR